MHLHHPSLSLNGKRKGKQKFKSAQAAQQSRQLTANWEQLLKKHGVQDKKLPTEKPKEYSPKLGNYRGSDQPRIPSVEFTGDACTRAHDKVYTGTKMIGVGTMHKSNAVPIFSDDDARNLSAMRR